MYEHIFDDILIVIVLKNKYTIKIEEYIEKSDLKLFEVRIRCIAD